LKPVEGRRTQLERELLRLFVAPVFDQERFDSLVRKLHRSANATLRLVPTDATAAAEGRAD
jgi:hypothetical protein